jgi:hypothetical protein
MTHLEKTANSRKHESAGALDQAVGSGDALWQYGWTHYGASGQTRARLHSRTRDVEIMDDVRWVRCAAGTDVFFTPGYLPA